MMRGAKLPRGPKEVNIFRTSWAATGVAPSPPARTVTLRAPAQDASSHCQIARGDPFITYFNPCIDVNSKVS